VVRVPGDRTEMNSVSCEVRTECICYVEENRPPLWSSGQRSWLQILRSGVRFPALPHFLRSSGSGTGPLSLVSTTEELLGRKRIGPGLESREYGRRDPSRWPRGTLYPQKLALTTEELLERKSSGPGLESREYGRRDPSRWPRDTLYPQKLALTSPTSGGRSVDIVRSRTQATEYF
jgi:hypothetical protein